MSTVGQGKTAVIIGAGPAGLTAAFELLKQTQYKVIVIERSARLGGISATIEHKGYKIDMGGHRFFSKSDRVMRWWLEIMPVQDLSHINAHGFKITYQNQEVDLDHSKLKGGPDPDKVDDVLLLRNRYSQIFYRNKFFDYPLKISRKLFFALGFFESFLIVCSYLKAVIAPIKPETNLEQFFTNRFGRRLYETFFKDYTEKVWGVSCKEIDASWGAQRVKGLSITKAVYHAVRNIIKPEHSLAQKSTESSLVERFLYPKFGPGQMWDIVGAKVKAMGGQIVLNHLVDKIEFQSGRVQNITITDQLTGQQQELQADLFINTMPLSLLLPYLGSSVPQKVTSIASNLHYRDFIAVALVFDRSKIKYAKTDLEYALAKNTWIYIQEPGMRVGRVQIYNNWSPYLSKNKDDLFIGMEYFCHSGDDLWESSDQQLIDIAMTELHSMGLRVAGQPEESTVIRYDRTYPSYIGAYKDFEQVRQYLDTIPNLISIGRNGMHRYNNQDHSMLCAFELVQMLVHGETSRERLWKINTEMDYHEEKNAPGK